MGVIIVNKEAFEHNQGRINESLEVVKNLRKRKDCLFAAMAELIDEANNQLKFIEKYEGEDWVEREEGYWLGVIGGLEMLKDTYKTNMNEIQLKGK